MNLDIRNYLDVLNGSKFTADEKKNPQWPNILEVYSRRFLSIFEAEPNLSDTLKKCMWCLF